MSDEPRDKLESEAKPLAQEAFVELDRPDDLPMLDNFPIWTRQIIERLLKYLDEYDESVLTTSNAMYACADACVAAANDVWGEIELSSSVLFNNKDTIADDFYSLLAGATIKQMRQDRKEDN